MSQNRKQNKAVCIYICDHGQDGHHIKNLFPRSNVACLRCHWPSELCSKLPSIDSHLQDVVEEGEKRGQWKRGYEYCYEAKLDHCKTHRKQLV